MLRPFQLAWVFFRVGAMNELQYRVNFVMQMFQSLLALATGLVVLSLVFSHATDLRGWTHPELLAVLGVHLLMGGAIRVSIQPNMDRLMEEIRDGKLDHALTKPEDAQLLLSLREVRIWQGVDLVTGTVVLAFAVTRLQASAGPLDALAFGVLLLVGAMMIYCFWLVLATAAFWVVRMHQAVELFQGVYQTGRWPVGVYPPLLRISLTFLVPIGFAVTVPAEAATGRLEWETVLLALGFGVALFSFARWFFRRGVRRYSGASA
jgi:ABC-2 type transport system permease protein